MEVAPHGIVDEPLLLLGYVFGLISEYCFFIPPSFQGVRVRLDVVELGMKHGGDVALTHVQQGIAVGDLFHLLLFQLLDLFLLFLLLFNLPLSFDFGVFPHELDFIRVFGLLIVRRLFAPTVI